MKFRPYNKEIDKDAVFRILNEVGWVSDANKSKYLNVLLPAANTLVCEINGAAEVMVNSTPGTMQYIQEELTLTAITGVTASLIARKQGFSGELTATRLAMDAAAGSELAALTIFDQGYYNKLGFGNGHYESVVSFSPSYLRIDRPVKTPVRFTDADLAKIHQARCNRMTSHGAVTLTEYSTDTEMGQSSDHVGLGYVDADGTITHHLWLHGKGKENGPVWIDWMSYQNYDQLMDLLALIKSFEEQYHLVSMIEPANIQMQDFLKRPYQVRALSHKGKYQNSNRNTAYWQFRILNLKTCIQKTHLNCADFSFNLTLTDPITPYIPAEYAWKGVAGNYTITLGEHSSASTGFTSGLPTMQTSVNAFSRMWFGILPASSLVYSDGLQAPKELLHKLDKAFLLPTPHIDWDF